MGSLIKKYAKGTPKPFAVAVKKTAATEQEASMVIVASGDRKATASLTKEGKYVVRYRKWFDTAEAAQAFVDTASAKSKPVAVGSTKEDVPTKVRTATEIADFPLADLQKFVREDLNKMVKTCQDLIRLATHEHYTEITNQLNHLVNSFIPILLKTIERVTEGKAEKAKKEESTKEAKVEPSISQEKVAEIKSGLEKLATFCTQRELVDLAAKTKSVLDLI